MMHGGKGHAWQPYVAIPSQHLKRSSPHEGIRVDASTFHAFRGMQSM